MIIIVLQEMVWNIVHDCDFETAKSKTMDERYIFESKVGLHLQYGCLSITDSSYLKLRYIIIVLSISNLAW